MGKRYTSQTQSRNQFYPDFNGDGRADLRKINPNTNIGQTFFNICRNKGQGSGLDDLDMQNPNEPDLPQCPINGGDFDEDQDNQDEPGASRRDLQVRASGREVRLYQMGVAMSIIALAYPNWRRYLELTPVGNGTADQFYTLGDLDCYDTEMRRVTADSNGALSRPLPQEWETTTIHMDHVYDLQSMGLFLDFAVTGTRLAGRGQTTNRTIQRQVVRDTINDPTGLPPSVGRQMIAQRILAPFGHNGNPEVMAPLLDRVNMMKGRLFGGLQPLNLTVFRSRAEQAYNGDAAALTSVSSTMCEVYAVFAYVNEPTVWGRMLNITAEIDIAFGGVERDLRWAGVRTLWREFLPDHFDQIVQASYDWMVDAIGILDGIFSDDLTTLTRRTMIRLVQMMYQQLDRIYIDKHRPNRRPGE